MLILLPYLILGAALPPPWRRSGAVGAAGADLLRSGLNLRHSVPQARSPRRAQLFIYRYMRLKRSNLYRVCKGAWAPVGGAPPLQVHPKVTWPPRVGALDATVVEPGRWACPPARL